MSPPTKPTVGTSVYPEGEACFRLLAESIHAGLMIVGNNRIVYANPWMCALFGYSREEMLATPFPELIVPEEREVIAKILASHARSGQLPHEINFWAQCRDGSRRFLVNYLAPADMPEAAGGFFLIAIDQTERRQIEDIFETERERLMVTLRSIGDGVISTDIAGRVLTLNRSAERLTGWSEDDAHGHSLDEVFSVVGEESRQPAPDLFAQIVASGAAQEAAEPVLLLARGGGECLVACSAAPVHDRDGGVIGVVLVFRDVTSRRRLEDDQNRAQKLESLGILAGGIAHDFNNILTAILGNITLVKMRLGGNDPQRERLAVSEQAALRARELTQQLLTFSRGGAPIKRTVQLADIIRDAAPYALRGSNVTCSFHLADDLWPIHADPDQIGRVIHNLVVNADQAMLSGGVIEISAGNIELDGSTGLPAGLYVCTAVRDHGGGIPAESLDRIYDPYFSTKPMGSGLGLTVVYSIIRKHDGHIEVQSVPGEGSTFIFYLPAVESPTSRSPRDEDTEVAGRSEEIRRVLLMDDEDIIIDVAGEMLNILGYETAIARDGMEALAIYSEALQAGQPFAAVIMDLTVPGGLGGRETVSRLLEIDPQARAIVSSGYFNDPVMANYREHGFRGIVNKPYRIEELEQVLKEVLHGG
jgi:two-component system, cell cycle sensor histidine kinase and response regulator CckA